MNSVDDFAALRPDVDPIDAAGLDRLWNDIVAPVVAVDHPTDEVSDGVTFDFVEDHSSAANRTGRRRLVYVGAAAAVLLGVVGSIVVLTGRPDAPDPLVDRPVVSTPVDGVVASTGPVDVALGMVPQWRITEPGWQLTEFEEVVNFPPGVKVAGAVVEGEAAAGWVIVYPSAVVSDPPIPQPEGRPLETMVGVSVGPAPSDPDNWMMNWGGYPQAEASEAARVALGARSTVSMLAHQQLDASGAFDMTRSWRYVFEGPDGQALRVLVRGGGEAYADDFSMMIPPQPLDAVEGIDEDALLLLGNGTRLVRTGFWVTTIEPDDPPESVDRAVALTGLVELVPEADRLESQPVVDAGADAGVGVEVLGPRPVWTVDADGWSEVPDVDGDGVPPTDGTRMFVSQSSPGVSWFVVSPPLSSGAVSPVLPESGSVTFATVDVGGMLYEVTAGGLDDDIVGLVEAAVAGDSERFGFVELEPSALEASAISVRQEFVGPQGITIAVDINSGGKPVYDDQASFFETEPDIERAGVDESIVQVIGANDRSVSALTGFWVSTITVSGASAGDFGSLVGLVQLADFVTANPPAIARLAIGDSVMLGAAQQLSALDFVVDAMESRVFGGGLDTIRALQKEDRLPDTMVVHLGGNGLIDDANMAVFVDLVADVGSVVLLTSAIDAEYSVSNNDLIFATAVPNENIRVLDWDGFSDGCPGDCFHDDGIHLKPDGRDYYVALIAEMVDGSD